MRQTFGNYNNFHKFISVVVKHRFNLILCVKFRIGKVISNTALNHHIHSFLNYLLFGTGLEIDFYNRLNVES